MKGLLRIVDLVSRAFGRVAEVMVVILIAAMLYEVTARYVLGAPTVWAFDIAYMSTGALFILGAAQTLREDGHVRIDLLSSRLPPRLRAGIDGIAFLIVLAPIFGWLAFIAGGRTLHAFRTGEVETVSPWAPLMWPFYLLLTLGLAALALQLAAEGIRALTGRCRPGDMSLES